MWKVYCVWGKYFTVKILYNGDFQFANVLVFKCLQCTAVAMLCCRWLVETHNIPGAINLLFSASACDRLFELILPWVYLIDKCLQCFDTVGWTAGRASGLQKTEWWGAGMVICLEWCADLHMAQLMPLPLTVSCFSKIQTGFTFLVPADLGSPGQRPVLQAWLLKLAIGAYLL